MINKLENLISCFNPSRYLNLFSVQKIQRFIYYFRAGKYRIILDRLKRQVPFIKVKKYTIELINPDDFQDYLEFDKFETPLVSIVIPVFNQWHHTRSCLTAIYKNTSGIAYEVIVADDASSDETGNIQQYFGNVVVNKNEKNLGFLRNCNLAAQSARGKYITFLNNDTNVQPGWLEYMLKLVEADSKIGLVGPMLLYPNGKLQEAGGIIWQDANGWNYGNGDYPERSEYNYLKEADYISGACIVVRRKIWDQLKGFDESFIPAYYEDTDLAFSIRRLGYKVVYQPLSRVVHLEGVSHGKDLDSGIKRFQEVNRLKFEDKWKDVLSVEQCVGSQQLFLARDRSRNRKILLYIDHYVPLPDRDAGSKSTYQYLELLASMGYRVTFVGDNFVDYEPYTTMLQQLGIEVLYGPWYRQNWKTWIKQNSEFIHYIFMSRPHITRKYLPFVQKNTKAKLIYCGHDLHYLREHRHYEVSGNKADLKESRKWERLEKYIISNVDVSYFFSSYEVEKLNQEIPDANIKSIPLYLVDSLRSSDQQLLPGYSERRDLLFVGGFMHTPNIDAVIWFVNKIFPLVREYVPDIEFNVVGSNPTPEVLKISKEGVNILGEISSDELQKLYTESRIVVAPLRFGSGVKGKILESLEFGVPVITTSIGAEGIPDSNKALYVTDEIQEFASHVKNVYSSPELWKKTVEQGYDLLEKYFSSESARKILMEDMPV